MVDANNFLIDSDFSCPHILKAYSKNVTVSSSDYGTNGYVRFNHNLPFTPLIIGVWNDSSEPFWRDIISNRPGYPWSMPLLVEYANSSSSDIEVGVMDSKYPSGTITTYSWKIAIIAPPDYTGDVSITSSEDNTNFIYNSLVESPKIALFDYVDVAPGQTVSIPHGQNGIPIVRVWNNRNPRYGESYQRIYTGMVSSMNGTKISNSDIIFSISSYGENTRFYYMVFKI